MKAVDEALAIAQRDPVEAAMLIAALWQLIEEDEEEINALINGESFE